MHRSRSAAPGSKIASRKSLVEMDELPILDPLSDIAKKEALRYRLAKNAVHLIPVVLVLCAVVPWFFSSPLSLDLSISLSLACSCLEVWQWRTSRWVRLRLLPSRRRSALSLSLSLSDGLSRLVLLSRSRPVIHVPADNSVACTAQANEEGLASDFGFLGVPWCRSKHGKTVEWTTEDLLKGACDSYPPTISSEPENSSGCMERRNSRAGQEENLHN